MIHLFELLFLFLEEAGRPIKKTIGFRLPRDLPGCPAWERAARAALLHAASNYSRTANFRAMITFATPLPRRNFNR
jgi:hypothetical protein